ncbi:magnesium chelatase domain-containing protein, partial [Anaerobiospirillum succiniciproducens]
VLHRHAGIQLADQDVFVNVVGGVKIDGTSSDVPLILALLSSFTSRPIERTCIAFGEIGLTGEIRPVQSGLERLNEAEKQGFTKAIIPADNAPHNKKKIGNMEIVAVSNIQQLVELV